MNRIISILSLVSVLSVTVAFGQIEGRIKPPTTTTTTKPKPQKKPTKPTNRRDAILSELASNMVYVEGGTFTMGGTNEQGDDANGNEKPTHQVTLSSFHICKYEVTWELWHAVMGDLSDFAFKKKPIDHVNWEECQQFITKLNQLTGKQYRLPTEAEWEFAARGGNRSKGYKYAGSNNIEEVAWYNDNSGSLTHEVGEKKANELGLYDMAGNVWEWCSDWMGDYSSGGQTNPSGASSGSRRVTRGGGNGIGAGSCRVSHRGSLTPTLAVVSVGLRLAL